MHLRAGRAQSVLEYSLLFGIILVALVIMQVYIKRAYQGRIKMQADQLGSQYAVNRTTSLVITRTTSNTTSYTGGTTASGANVSEGESVTLTNTTTEFSKQERVDSFK